MCPQVAACQAKMASHARPEGQPYIHMRPWASGNPLRPGTLRGMPKNEPREANLSTKDTPQIGDPLFLPRGLVPGPGTLPPVDSHNEDAPSGPGSSGFHWDGDHVTTTQQRGELRFVSARRSHVFMC